MKQAYTHLGYADYFGQTHLYDGNFYPKCEGTTEEVIAYLGGLYDWQAKIEEDSIKWRGHNGEWYAGDEALKALDQEIESLKDGSHNSLNY